MDHQFLVERQPGGLQHGRPEDRVRLEDVLADHVPGVRKQVQAPLIGQCGHVVEQRVKPHIGDVIGVPGQLDAPGYAGFGPRDAQVAHRLAQHLQHLVAVAARRDEAGILAQVLQQPALVLLHPEEVVGLAAQFGGVAVTGIHAIHQFLVGHVALGAHRIQALVLGEIDVARIVDLLQNLLHVALVAVLGGADEVVVTQAQPVPQFAKGVVAQVVGEGLGRLAAVGRQLDDALAVLVGAGQEVGLVPGQAVKAGDRIGQHLLEDVPDVRRPGQVIDGGSDIERRFRCIGIGLDRTQGRFGHLDKLLAPCRSAA